MKKLITILLTSLMLITTLSVNVLAENKEITSATLIYNGHEVVMERTEYLDEVVWIPVFENAKNFPEKDYYGLFDDVDIYEFDLNEFDVNTLDIVYVCDGNSYSIDRTNEFTYGKAGICEGIYTTINQDEKMVIAYSNMIIFDGCSVKSASANYKGETVNFVYNKNVSEYVTKDVQNQWGGTGINNVYIAENVEKINPDDFVVNFSNQLMVAYEELTDSVGYWEYDVWMFNLSDNTQGLGIELGRTTEDGAEYFDFIFYVEQSPSAASFIKPYNLEKGDDYVLGCNQDAGVYYWDIFVDANQLIGVYGHPVISVEFVSNTAGESDIVQLDRNGNQVNYESDIDEIISRTIEQKDDADVLILGLRGNSYNCLEIKVTNENGESSVQRHVFQLVVTFERALENTMIKGINVPQMSNYNVDFISNSGMENNLITNPVFGIFFNNDQIVNEFTDSIRNLNDNNHSELNLESGVFEILLKDSCSISNKQYTFFDGFPAVAYTITDGSKNQNITLVAQCAKDDGDYINIFDMPYIFTEKDGHQIYTPAFGIYDISPENVIDITNGQYDIVVLRVNEYHNLQNTSNAKVVYEDGNYYIEDSRVEYLFYGSNISLDDAIKEKNIITDLKPYYYSAFYNESSIEEDRDRWLEFTRLVYTDIDGENIIATKHSTLDEFENQGGAGAFIHKYVNNGRYCSDYIFNGGISTSASLFQTKGYTENYSSDRNGRIIQVTNEQELIDAIAELETYYNSEVVLMNDISLSKDLIIDHHDLFGAPSNQDNYGLWNQNLMINLNGHQINCNEHAIETIRYAQVKFINSNREGIAHGTSEPIISGSGSYLIKDYSSSLGFVDDVVLKNPSGTAIRMLSCAQTLALGMDASIKDSNIGIEIVEDTGASFDRQQPEVRMFGSIDAKEIAIKVDTPNLDKTIRLNLMAYRTNNNDARVYIDSNNQGIVANGKVEFFADGVVMNAKNPFVVTDGSYTLRCLSTINCDNSLFYIDSANAKNDANVLISINGGEQNAVNAGGALVEQTQGKNIVSNVSFFSNNGIDYNHYFAYGNGGMFVNVPKQNISITGGSFKNNYSDYDEFLKYFNNYLAPGIVLSTKPDSDKSVVAVENKVRYVQVDNVAALKAACGNPLTSIIHVTDDISCNEEIIDVVCNNEKHIDLMGNTLSNVTLRFCVTEGAVIDADHGINDGSIINNNEKPAIIVEGSRVNLHNIDTLESKGNVILMKGGELSNYESHITINGSNSIVVDSDNMNSNIFLGNVTINNENGPVVYVKNTMESEEGSMIHFGGEGNGRSATINTNDNYPVILSDDNCSAIFANVTVNGGSYLVDFTDNIPEVDNSISSQAFVRVMNDSVVNTINGVRLSKDAAALLENCEFNTTENTVEAYTSSRVMIPNGKYKCGDEYEIIKYINNSSNHTNHDVTGGQYSREVLQKSLEDTYGRPYSYVCLQVDDLSAEYPFRVVRQEKVYSQDNFRLRLFTSIDQEYEVNVDNLENAITDDEKTSSNNDLIFVVDKVDDGNVEKNIQSFFAPGQHPEIKDYLDMYVVRRAEKENNLDIEDLSETFQYQKIEIRLDPNKYDQAAVLNSLFIVHSHIDKKGHENKYLIPRSTKKVLPTVEDVGEECFFVIDKNGTYYIVLFTRQYSTFALGYYPEHEHTYENVPASAPTCETDGYEAYEQCTVCGLLKGDKVIIPAGHTYSSVLSSNETHHWYDTTCGHDVQKDVGGHVWNDGEVTKNPTHLTEGEKTCTCICGKTKIVSVDKLSKHTFDQKVVDEKYLASAADCEHAAKYYVSCLCGKDGTETFENGSALGHKVTKVEGRFEGEDIVATHYECEQCNKKSLSEDMSDSMNKEDFIIKVDTLKDYLSSVADETNPVKVSEKMDYVSSLIPADIFSRIISNEMVNESDNPLVDILKDVETALKSSNLTVEINEDVIAKEKIDVIGAGLNSGESLVLKIDACKDETAMENYLETRNDLDSENSFGFSVTLIKASNGEAITELSVPITVTLEVPEGLDSSKIVLLHRHNGVYNQIGFSLVTIEGKEYIRFVVSGLSDFVIVERIITPSTPGSGTSGYKAPKTGIR